MYLFDGWIVENVLIFLRSNKHILAFLEQVSIWRSTTLDPNFLRHVGHSILEGCSYKEARFFDKDFFWVVMILSKLYGMRLKHIFLNSPKFRRSHPFWLFFESFERTNIFCRHLFFLHRMLCVMMAMVVVELNFIRLEHVVLYFARFRRSNPLLLFSKGPRSNGSLCWTG